MTTRARRTSQFQMLPVAWEYDGQIMQVSVQAELLFLRMISLSNSVQSSGRLSAAQVRSCARGMRNLRSACAELVSAELLSHNADSTEYHINDRARWFLAEPNADVAPHKPGVKSPGQKTSAPKTGDNDVPRGGARVKREREKEREEERTPSGSVRSSSAQAAPRVAGGATQPAPDVEVPESGTMSGAEARAAIRATLDRAKQTVPGSTGRNTNFSKYDPDRPITPIQSAMAAGLGAE